MSTIMMVLMERGEMVISEASHPNTDSPLFVLETPALVVHERTPQGALGFVLAPWLPHELLSGTTIILGPESFKGVLTPSPQMVRYYQSWSELERERLAHYAKSFGAQVADIERFHREKLEKFKTHMNQALGLSPTMQKTMIELFENNIDWGDPSVTH